MAQLQKKDDMERLNVSFSPGSFHIIMMCNSHCDAV